MHSKAHELTKLVDNNLFRPCLEYEVAARGTVCSWLVVPMEACEREFDESAVEVVDRDLLVYTFDIT